MDIALSKLDLNKVYDFSVIFVFGGKASGKSWFIKDLLWHKQCIPHGTIIADNHSDFYNNFIPNITVHNEYTYNSNILAECIKRQSDLRTQFQETRIRSDRRTFVVLDMCLHDSKWVHDRCVKPLIFLSQTFELLPIVALENARQIPPILYANFDYVFVFRIDDITERMRIYQRCSVRCIITFDVFCQLLDKYTTDYGCLVIYVGSRSKTIENCLFWYKANEHLDFKMMARCDSQS